MAFQQPRLLSTSLIQKTVNSQDAYSNSNSNSNSDSEEEQESGEIDKSSSLSEDRDDSENSTNSSSSSSSEEEQSNDKQYNPFYNPELMKEVKNGKLITMDVAPLQRQKEGYSHNGNNHNNINNNDIIPSKYFDKSTSSTTLQQQKEISIINNNIIHKEEEEEHIKTINYKMDIEEPSSSALLLRTTKSLHSQENDKKEKSIFEFNREAAREAAREITIEAEKREESYINKIKIIKEKDNIRNEFFHYYNKFIQIYDDVNNIINEELMKNELSFEQQIVKDKLEHLNLGNKFKSIEYEAALLKSYNAINNGNSISESYIPYYGSNDEFIGLVIYDLDKEKIINIVTLSKNDLK